MNSGFDYTTANGLYVSVDWLSWTMKGDYTPYDAIGMMGYSVNDFQKIDRGANGYRSMFKHLSNSIRILYDGSDDMGIHIDVTGSSIQDLLQHYEALHSSTTPFGTSAYDTNNFNTTILADLLKEILSVGQLTRFDLAIDDFGANYYTMAELFDIFRSGSYISKSRTLRIELGFENGQDSGTTIYLGSRKSDLMLRIYDKQKEQNKKRKNQNQALIESPWVRWEFELKDIKAVGVALLLLSNEPVSNICLQVLSGYLRIINLDNERKSRCSVNEKWLRFIDGMKGISLYFAPPEKSIEQKKEWIRKQVAPTLSMIVQSEGGDLGFIYDILESGNYRLSAHQRVMVLQALGGSLNDFE